MGGRGGSSGMSNEKPVSKLMAKVYFNSTKKSTALREGGWNRGGIFCWMHEQ